VLRIPRASGGVAIGHTRLAVDDESPLQGEGERGPLSRPPDQGNTWLSLARACRRRSATSLSRVWLAATSDGLSMPTLERSIALLPSLR
jgi:hypothetical protein